MALAYYLVAGFGVYLLLRDFDAGFWPSVLGGVAFMLSPHLVSMGVFGHGSKLASGGYLPYSCSSRCAFGAANGVPVGSGCSEIVRRIAALARPPADRFYGAVHDCDAGAVEVVGAWRAG